MENNKKQVCVLSPHSGCPLRCLDAAKLKKYFYLNNFTLVNSVENADYIIFVTCSVSPLQLENSFETIREIQKTQGELIVMGCLPGANEIELRTIFSGKAIATKNISDVDKFFPDFRIKYHQVPEAYSYDIETYNVFSNIKNDTPYFELLSNYGFSRTFFRKAVRSYHFKNFIKSNIGYNISDRCFIITSRGCSNNCTYCNIRESVGKITSKQIDVIVKEYTELLSQGYRLFHLIADDLCSYGLDIKSSLSELLKSLSVIDTNYKVKWSLHGINPAWLVKHYNELIPLLTTQKIWEITLAIESGSDRIIKLMNRHYKIKEVEKVLRTLRSINPGLRLDALFFMGFPTETDEDFNNTLEFIKKVRFDDARITYYTEFERVPSAKIFPKVSEDIVNKRILIAEELLRKIKADSLFVFRLQHNIIRN